jgi:hypothetical protein
MVSGDSPLHLIQAGTPSSWLAVINQASVKIDFTVSSSKKPMIGSTITFPE